MWDGLDTANHYNAGHNNPMQNGGASYRDGDGDMNGGIGDRGADFGVRMVAAADANIGTGTDNAESGGMVELTRLEYDGSQGRSEPLWVFDGRIDEGSVWGLLNRY